MSEPIQSIAQNNYILHNIDAKKLYVQEPLFTANSGDAVYVGWRPDETVLWEADLNVSVADRTSGTTFSLSESPTNFENLKIYCAKSWPLNGNNDCGAFFNEVPTAMLNKQNNGVMMLHGYMAAANKVYQLFTRLTGCLTTNITEAAGVQTTNGSGNLGSTIYLHPYKIVGVNRKENA